MSVCIDVVLTMLGFRSEFTAKIKGKTPNAIGLFCLIHREALNSRRLPTVMKDNLATIIRAVNCVKTSAVNAKLCTKLCKDMDSNHETLLFRTFIRWLSKVDMLARMYKMKDELKLLFEAHGKQYIFCQPN